MMKKIPIRLRLTALSILLLSVCCAGLTVILNLSASRMVNVIEATPVRPPAAAADEGGEIPPLPMTVLTPSKQAQAARYQFQYQSVLVMLLVILTGGGLTYYMTGKALTPLQELRAQMNNRTVHNLSEELVVPHSRDEIADLTVSFNQMSNKLNEAFAMQKRFSQSAAHELRTPLTVLKTKVDVFKKKRAHTPAEYDKLLSVITTHTDRLSDLVKDLLDLTNMDALDCNEKLALKALLLELAQELAPLAAERGVTLSVGGIEQQITGNKSLLHRAFYNLVENGIKYNLENGAVSISVDCSQGRPAVHISDTGIGIPQEMQELIFEPFFRVDKSRSRQMGGAGLGLATVRAIIEKHHGQIAVEKKPAGGTVFTVTL